MPTQHLDRKGQPQIPMTPYTVFRFELYALTTHLMYFTTIHL